MSTPNQELVQVVLSKLSDPQLLARFLDQPRAVFAELTAGKGDEATLEEVGRRLRDRTGDGSLSEAELEGVAGGFVNLSPKIGRTSLSRMTAITDTR
jgi:hypothetical protein